MRENDTQISISEISQSKVFEHEHSLSLSHILSLFFESISLWVFYSVKSVFTDLYKNNLPTLTTFTLSLYKPPANCLPQLHMKDVLLQKTKLQTFTYSIWTSLLQLLLTQLFWASFVYIDQLRRIHYYIQTDFCWKKTCELIIIIFIYVLYKNSCQINHKIKKICKNEKKTFSAYISFFISVTRDLEKEKKSNIWTSLSSTLSPS